MRKKISSEKAQQIAFDYKDSGDSFKTVGKRHGVHAMTVWKIVSDRGIKPNHRRLGEKTHGLSGSREYRIWASMINRCTNKNSAGYRDYGGNGITVCDEWMSFENFISDMGCAPSCKHTLDRIIGSLGYNKENCRWATRDIQNRNTSRNVFVSIGGESLTISEWAERTGIDPRTISMRIRRGWDARLAITTPVTVASSGPSGTRGNHKRKNNVILSLGNEQMCLADWASRFGVSPQAIKNRLKRGWSVEKALTEPFRSY